MNYLARQTAWALVLLATLLPAARGEDAATAVGSFLQNMFKSGSAPSPAGEGLGKLLNLGNSQPSRAPAKTDTPDLLELLTQSTGQIDEAHEIEIGRQLGAVLLWAKPLHPDMALQAYVNRLGRWISLQSARPNLPWTFAVLDDAGYNAFAAPGGYVFVTKGLLDALHDESELAGVLAHEITHVLSKHHLQAIRKSAQSGLLTRAVATQLSKSAAGGLSDQLLGLGRDLYSKGLDQSDELEADRNGVALAARAGFDPYGLVAALTQLRSAAPDNPLFALQMSTHPAAQVRLDQLELAMGQRLDGLVGGAPVTLAQRLAKMGASK